MKYNKEMWKRASTYQNIIEALCVVMIQFLMDMPAEMTTALWGALSLRILMAFVQATRKSNV